MSGRPFQSSKRHCRPFVRRRGGALAEALESLERRSMLAASTLNVTEVLWSGKAVEAVKDEYVFRMPQLNAATAKSPVDYQCKTPTIPVGWSLQPLGSGFFKMTAPRATQPQLVNWASKQGAQSINVNAVRQFQKTPNDPLYGDTSNWAFPKISADRAWDTGTGLKSTIVAVLDSGVDYNHVDLAANMWRNPNEVPADGIDNDNNGYVDDIFGIDAVSGTSNPMDNFGHGTFCAGLISAVGNNAVGMTGVNWTTQIMAVKIVDAAGIPLAAEIRGINYVIAQKTAGQNIIAANCSYGDGGYAYIQSQFDALNQLALTGVTIVASAGNDANDNDVRAHYPSNYQIEGLIAVAASDQNDNLAIFSNFGANTVDLAAPGVNVLSTRLVGGQVGTALIGNTAYGVASGTSFAAPLVAGTVALLKSLKPAASTGQIKAAILGGVDKVAGLAGQVLTGGRLNVKNAVDLVISTQGATPVASITAGQNLKFLEGNSGYSYADIKVSLDRPADKGKSVAVWYETRPGGSAISGTDFVAASGFLTFSGSEMEKSFRIKLVGDRVAEQEEQFAVRLEQAKSKGVTIGNAQASVSILDDDATATPVQPGETNSGLVPLVSIGLKKQPDPTDPAQMIPVPIREGGVATFVVSLDKTTNKTVSVRYRTNQPVLVPTGVALEGRDYFATSGTLTFRPGERTKEFTVKILADAIKDDNETFRVVLSEPVNAQLSGGSGTGGGGAVDATIRDIAPVAPKQPGFQITLSFPDSSLTTTQQQVFQQAVTRWQEIIVGDLPDVLDPTTGQTIDDVLIVATGAVIDGRGGRFAEAGPTEVRTGAKGLPWKGEMFFDTADVAELERGGTLVDVILHEMGHVLGFGTLWGRFGLLQGAGTANPLYVGVNALREYKSIFAVPSAAGVPVANSGGAGTADVHWRETIFVTELMTDYVEAAGTKMPISRITVGQFQDLGYTVNYAKADAYTKPAIRGVVPPAGTPKSNVRMALLAPGVGALGIAESAARSAVTSPAVAIGASPRTSASVGKTALTEKTALTVVMPSQSAGIEAGQPSGRKVFAAIGRG